MKIGRILIVSLFCVFSSIIGEAKNQNEEVKILHNEKVDTLEVYFRQGYSLWEPNFKNNAERMKIFVERIKQIQRDTAVYKVSKIHIVSGASPEGNIKMNERLSANRAKRIRTVLKSYIDLPDTIIVEDSRGVNWKGLEDLVMASDMEYKDEVLNILHTAPEFMNNKEVRKLRLAYLRDGKPWEYMYKNFFPKLRSFNLQIVVEWEKVERNDRSPAVKALPTPEIKPLALKAPIELKAPTFEFAPMVKSPFYMAVRTNLLYDAVLVPNVGVEFYLGDGFSIGGNWMYSWWHSRDWDWWHRTYGGDLEVRKYFGSLATEKPLQGWHVGLYGQMVTYDFEMGGRGYLGDRWTWGGGVSIGYSLPIKRRFNLDFSLGLGYLGGEYKEYLPIDGCYVWQCTKDRNWFGPTKLEVSLVWLVGRGNYNLMKGGAK